MGALEDGDLCGWDAAGCVRRARGIRLVELDAQGRHPSDIAKDGGCVARERAELGLTEIGSVPGSVDSAEVGDVNPHAQVWVAVHPHSDLIPVAQRRGRPPELADLPVVHVNVHVVVDVALLVAHGAQVDGELRRLPIVPRDGKVWAIDQGSTNGTFLNGQKITEVQLKRGDALVLGDNAATFVYQI